MGNERRRRFGDKRREVEFDSIPVGGGREEGREGGGGGGRGGASVSPVGVTTRAVDSFLSNEEKMEMKCK